MCQNGFPFYGPFKSVHHIMCVQTSFNGHLSRFCFLAVTNNSGINICFVPNAPLTEQSGFSLFLYCIYLLNKSEYNTERREILYG